MKARMVPSICLSMAAMFWIQSGWAADPVATDAAENAVPAITEADATAAPAQDAGEQTVPAPAEEAAPQASADQPADDADAAEAQPQQQAENPQSASDAAPAENNASTNGDIMAQDQAPDFLAENAKKEGVETTASGLQYKILKAGEGAKPKETDNVTVQYEGRLTDGTVFDSSYKRGQPAQFRLNQVIQGWTEGLQLMQEGSTWELYIPASLAYGANGIPGVIPPNSPLIFKVELIKVSG